MFVLFIFQCSFHPRCTSSRISNENSVVRYSNSYGTRAQTYDCFVNPVKPTEMIRIRKFHIGYVIHGLTWPTVFVIVNVIVLIVLIKKKQIIILQSIYKPWCMLLIIDIVFLWNYCRCYFDTWGPLVIIHWPKAINYIIVYQQ